MFVRELQIYRFLYLKVFGQEIISVYSYGEYSMFGIQLFNKKVI